jgi:hypothetical protein
MGNNRLYNIYLAYGAFTKIIYRKKIICYNSPFYFFIKTEEIRLLGIVSLKNFIRGKMERTRYFKVHLLYLNFTKVYGTC